MGNRTSDVAKGIADRLRGKKVIRWIDIARSASEAAERINKELGLEIENPDDFSELRDSIEKVALEFLDSRDDISIVHSPCSEEGEGGLPERSRKAQRRA